MTKTPDLRVALGPIELRHPVIDASGTFDVLEAAARYERDFLADFPFSAYVPKTVTREARPGNPPPRIAETPAGMINAIGLANPGVAAAIADLPRLATLREPVIVSVGGTTVDDYVAVVEAYEAALAAAAAGAAPDIVGYELNVSCPNVRSGCLSIGTDERETEQLVAAVRACTKRFLVTKLTPNVTDVVAIGRAALAGGSDGLSLINTLKAMVLDQVTLMPLLGNRTGGLCGPAIKPVALRMVSELAEALDAPIIGMGGVISGADVLEFIACGATAVAIGAANFTGIDAPDRIVAELRTEMEQRGLTKLSEVRGRALQRRPQKPS
jgi:dihydroorotate dehydrogenase (NAD+) catalytic subunit